MFVKFCHLSLAFIFLSYFASGVKAAGVQHVGRTKFEIFGMKDEYLMIFGDNDGKTIERFDPGQTAVAAHFEKLLHAYTAEENVSPDFTKTVDAEGFTHFLSPAITKDILRHYTKSELNDSEFKGASPEDLERYVFGAYTRYNYKRAAIINAANSWSKVRQLADCLSKLGCTGVHVYSFDATPTSNIVIFSPTTSLRQKLGIEKDISFAELNQAFQNGLKLEK